MNNAQDVMMKRKPATRHANPSRWLGTAAVVAVSAMAIAFMHGHPVAATNAFSTAPFVMQRVSEGASTRLPDGGTLTLHNGVLERNGQRFPLLERRHFASLTVMPTGQVLVWGGVDDQGHLVETGEWFEPSTEALVTTGRLGLPVRAAHTLNVLPDGTLAMTGGWEKGNRPAGDVAIWRPLDRQLELRRGEVGKPRFGAEARLMPDGSLTIAGGVDEIGRPRHDSWTLAGSPEAGRLSAHGLVDSWPRKDRTDVSPIGPLSLRFTESVDVRQLAGSVSLLGPNGMVAVRVVGVEDGKLAFVQLPDELYPSARYTLFVKGLHTARGEDVPYEAIGFTTRAAGNGVVQVGEGTRSPDRAAKQDEPPLYVMAGAGVATPCKPADAFHLCRDKGEVRDGAFYPGQDNVATASGGHWRLYRAKATLPDTRKREADLGKGATALIGQVRRIDESPVANVEISVDGQQVRTDADGVFVLPNLVAGRKELFVDGRPAGSKDMEYGRFIVGADVTAATVNHMPYVMYLPRVLERDKIALPSPTTRETVLTHPDMPGLELRIPAGAVFRDREGKVLDEIAIVPTPVDHAPFPLPDNFPMYFTIQPGDAVVQGMTPEAAKGLQIVYPNYGKQKPAERADFWVYSADKGWQMYGAGHVSADASQLVADKDTRLVWALGAGASVNPERPHNDGKICNQSRSQPIDVETGLFYHEWDDLFINDTLPISVHRTHNGLMDPYAIFGLGSGSSSDMTLSSSNGFESPILVMPCSQPIRFHLVSGQPVWPLVGTTWIHDETSSSFQGATLEFVNDSTSAGAHWVITMLDGTRYSFDRHAPNKLVEVSDRFGNKISYVYNNGLLDKVISPHGRSLAYVYNSHNLVSSVSDNSGRTVRYDYKYISIGASGSTGGVLARVTYPDSTFEEYTYRKIESQGVTVDTWFMETMRDRRGKIWVENQYDLANRIVKQKLADGSSYDFAYGADPGGLKYTVVTDPAGNRERFEFDPSSHYVKTVTRAFGTPLAQQVSYVRLASGLASSRIDPVGRSTALQRDGRGNILMMTSVGTAGESRTFKHAFTSDYNLPSSVTDPEGRRTQYEYEGGCLSAVVDPSGRVIKTTCDSEGNITSMMDAGGATYRFVYRAGDLLSISDPNGATTTFVYDSIGRRVSSTDAQGVVKTISYDLESRPSGSTDGSGGSFQYKYDPNGNLTEVRMPNGGLISYVWDSMNRLIERHDASGRVEKWAYGPNGIEKTYQDRKGQVTTYDYDALDRLILTTYADGSGLSQRYDTANRVVEFIGTDGSLVSRTYNDFDEMTSETSDGVSVAYGYDKAGQRMSMIASGGEALYYSYDGASRLLNVTRGKDSFSFEIDKAGRRSLTKFPNGMQSSYAYDSVGRVTGIVTLRESGEVVRSMGYIYDASDRRVAVTDSTRVGGVLSEAKMSSYGVDNRQVSANDSQREYDGNGNLLFDGLHRYQWNAKDQLIGVTGGGLNLTYSYDLLGRRKSKGINGDLSSYIYDGYSEIGEVHGQDIVWMLNGQGVDERLARIEKDSSTYLFTDVLGSVVLEASSAGDVVAEHRYGAYGELVSTGAGQNRFLYTGREMDAPDFYFFRSRYYDASNARFLSEDPIGISGGPNPYAYVLGNPISFTDPFGLAPRGTIVCDGRGGMMIVGDLSGPKGDCVRKHEQTHIDDYTRWFPELCKTGNFGDVIGLAVNEMARENRPNVPKYPMAASECHAYRVSLKCDSQCPGSEKEIARDLKQLEYYRCDQYGW